MLAHGCGTDESLPATQTRPPIIEDVTDTIAEPIDTSIEVSEDDNTYDTGSVEPDTSSSVDARTRAPDAGPPVGDGSIGAACYKDDQCAGDDWVCLDWNDGYCTAIGCPALSDCSETSVCITYGQQTNLCVQECQRQEDCRLGYGCKPVDSVSGAKTRACINLDGAVSALGGSFEQDTDCSGQLICLGFVSDGYCSELECSPDAPCPDESVCITYN